MRILNAALLLVLSGSPAFAQRVPAIVIPGRADVPVMMNGIDVSWSVVEGDYGLDRPIGMVPTVIYRPYAVMMPGPGCGHLFSAGAGNRSSILSTRRQTAGLWPAGSGTAAGPAVTAPGRKFFPKLVKPIVPRPRHPISALRRAADYLEWRRQVWGRRPMIGASHLGGARHSSSASSLARDRSRRSTKCFIAQF